MKHCRVVCAVLAFATLAGCRRTVPEDDVLFLQAVQDGNLPRIRALLDNGANVNAKGSLEVTPLHEAVRQGQLETMRLLLAKGAAIDAKDRLGWTPLYQAVYFGKSREVVQLLISNGANVDTKNKDGEPPLFLAVRRHAQHGVAELLIDGGADIHAHNRHGNTLAWVAIEEGCSQAVEKLLEKGIRVDERGPRGQTLLHHAAFCGDGTVVALLLAKGADANIKDDAGKTSLHYAANENCVRVAELLVAAGADADAVADSGMTPLHYAVRNGHYETAELLVDAGADRETRTKQGKTPLDFAQGPEREDLATLLKLGGGAKGPDAQTDESPIESIDENNSQDDESPLTDAQRLVRGNTAFAIGLYKQLRAGEGNLFFSPHSISTALAMTYAGAREDTAREMAETLRFSMAPERLHPAFAELQAGLNKVQEGGVIKLSVANSLWPQRGHPLLGEYLSLVEKYYGVSITSLDYSTDAAREASRQTINRWVAVKTQDKIRELLQPGRPSELTRLILTNAIYFDARWLSEFDPERTRPGAFYFSVGRSISVPMMHQTEVFRYGVDSSVQILELPYRKDERSLPFFFDPNEGLSMLILLPARVEGLSQLEQRLTVENLTRWRSQLKEQSVVVSMPRFRMTWKAEMKGVLQRMGMEKAFQWPGANFAGLDGDPNWFYIGQVIHKAYVDVNERGTEAAAATAVEMMMMGMPPKPPEFRADHPFLFLIQDNRTGSILFLGRVVDPTQTGE